MAMAHSEDMLSVLGRVRRWPLWPLVGLGLTFEAILLVGFTFAFPLWQLYRIPKLDLGLASGDSLTGALRFAGAVLALSVLYLAGWGWVKRLRSSRGGLPLIFAFGAIFAVTLIFLYPINSRDLFYYVYLTRLIGVYRSSPFGPPPEGVQADIVFPYLDWATLPMPYGPLWAVISRVFAAPMGWSFLSTLLAYKALAAVLFLASGLLIYWILIRRRPHDAVLAAQLWLWNPLVLLEWVGNGHNDGLMVITLLAATLSLVTGWGAAALILLALSAGTKYVPLLLFPIWLWQLLRARRGLQERAGFLALTLGIALVMVWLISPPWVRSPTLPGFLQETEYLGVSVAGLFRAFLAPIVKGDPSRTAFLLAATISLLAIA
ncbi:MAG: hypothetical protein HYX89_06020, partial [Chloroflexi bacterium]|nr:hypothetical protein [Chloroflexota bacterium]